IDAARELVVPSPFDYATQSRLYVPRHLLDPSRERAAWSSMAVNEMLELVRASQGRALLLFTSYSAMRNAYEMISGRIEYTCLIQGQQSNRVLSGRFMDDTHS